MIVTFLTEPGSGAQTLHGLLFCLKTPLSINCLKNLVDLVIVCFFLINMGTHNSPTLLIPFWTLTFRLCFQTNAIFAKVNRLWLLIAISIFCAGKWPTTTGFVRWRLVFGSNPKFIQWLSTISTETRCESRSRQSHISTLQSTATRTPTDQSRITFPARSNRSLFNSTLRNASYKSSSAIQTSSNRPLSASTLQSVTSQSNEPVTNIIIPTLLSQSQQSSASHILSQATESTTTQSTLSQPSPSGDATSVQPDSIRLGVNQSLTTTISGSSIEIPSLQTEPFSTTSNSKWQYVSPVKFASWVFNKFRSANRQWILIRFTTSCFAFYFSYGERAFCCLNRYECFSSRYFADYDCDKQDREKYVSLCNSFHCFLFCNHIIYDCL